jgi:hypothetical protein
MRRCVPAFLLLLSVACGEDSPGRPDSVPMLVDLSLNDQKMGAFSCSEGLFFAVDVANPSSDAARLERLSVRFTPTEGPCQQFDAPVQAALSLSLEAGGRVQARRFDAAGQICQPPYGEPGCAWTATAEVTSDQGTERDQLGFLTYRPSADCAGVVPRIVEPSDGALLTGGVEVLATVVEGAGCVMSARTIIRGFDADGRPVFTSGPLDLAEPYRWDTTRVPNGPYWLTAQQNCCGIPSEPTVVTVRN